MEEQAEQWQIDQQTFQELAKYGAQLLESLEWLQSTNQLEALQRLGPIVEGLCARLEAVFIGNLPEAGPILDSFNKVASREVSPEKAKELTAEFDRRREELFARFRDEAEKRKLQ